MGAGCREKHCFLWLLSHVRLFASPWTVTCQALLSMGFPSKNTYCHFLFQGIFPTQESNPRLLHWQVGSLPLTHQGSPGRNIQFSSVAQSCPTLYDPVNRSTPGLPLHHQLPEFTQTHVHRVGDAIQPSHPLSFPSPPTPIPSWHQGLFQ